MNFRPILQNLQKFVQHNSPGLLAGLGVAGVVSTAALTGRSAYRAGSKIREENQRRIDEGADLEDLLTKRETVELVWRDFVPPALVGGITIAAIIGSHRIGTRRAAAFATAYKLSEKMAEEYRQRVEAEVGPKKEEMIRSDVARERIQKADGVETIILNDAEIVFYDSWSARAFKSTRERVEAAVNQINYQINQQWACSLSEFYDLLGLEKTAVSDDFGWNSDELLEPYYTSTLLPDGKPACEIRYNTQPFQNFHKIGI